ncbi:MAG: (2Fe-2S) ferredoxin domain-containing protein [Gemmataceae bacterium]
MTTGSTPVPTPAPERQVPPEKLKQIAENLLIGKYQRHIFLCTGQACCTGEVGNAAWEVLKNECKRLNLSLSTGPEACYRTKVNCLRVCTNGPILVVYPEGTYYSGMTAERIPEFLQRHVIDGEPVEEWIFARNPMPNSAPAV